MKNCVKYSKLKEVCLDFIVPQRDKPKSFDGTIPWCRIEDIEGKYLNGSKSNQNVSKELADSMNMHICPQGTVICACSASIGNQAITTIDCYTNQTFIGVVVNPTLLFNEYLYYFFSFQKENLQKMGRGATIKYISRDKFENLIIPVPPVAEQERIVAELDLLSGIIEKKKEQLKAYDQLAQSIFYTMFGDPITNEKGWDIKKLGDIGKIITGNTPSTRDERNYDSDDVCFFKPSDIAKDGISLLGESEFHVSSFAYNNSRKLPKGSVLVTCIGIVGKVGILEIDAMCNQQINAIIPNEDVTSVYVAYSVLSERKIIESIAHAPVVPIINKGEFSQLCIPLPPLHLQEEFAEKVEAIERQKALVQQSIEETQTMFDYTMDKYFG